MIDLFLSKLNQGDWTFNFFLSSINPKKSLQSLFDSAKSKASKSLECLESEKYKKELNARITVLMSTDDDIKILIALKEVLSIANFYSLSKEEIKTVYIYLDKLECSKKEKIKDFWINLFKEECSFEKAFDTSLNKNYIAERVKLQEFLHEYLIECDEEKIYLILQLNIHNLLTNTKEIKKILEILSRDKNDLFIFNRVDAFYQKALKTGQMTSDVYMELDKFLKI